MKTFETIRNPGLWSVLKITNLMDVVPLISINSPHSILLFLCLSFLSPLIQFTDSGPWLTSSLLFFGPQRLLPLQGMGFPLCPNGRSYDGDSLLHPEEPGPTPLKRPYCPEPPSESINYGLQSTTENSLPFSHVLIYSYTVNAVFSPYWHSITRTRWN